jgi:hypothetical protein
VRHAGDRAALVVVVILTWNPLVDLASDRFARWFGA